MLNQRRKLKMETSAHAYVRGNALKFYECLECLQRRIAARGARGLDLR